MSPNTQLVLPLPPATGTQRPLSAGGRSRLTNALLAAAALLLFGLFFALGTWQIERRAWKHDLVARVDRRVHAQPIAAPGPAQWPQVNAADDAYRHVWLSGRFLHDRASLVQALTAQGAGFWVMTPLRMADGATVLVNRGFVPAEAKPRTATLAAQSADQVTVTGLLRITEPGGGFLRRNDAAGDRWFSRDVSAIASARGLSLVAPYFVDADAGVRAGSAAADNALAGATLAAPVGGLTVVAFHDNHLVYAITWYTLAVMVAGGAWIVRRTALRRAPAGTPMVAPADH